MHRRSKDLAISAGLGLVALVGSILPWDPHGNLWILLSLPVVLFAPGYVFLESVLPAPRQLAPMVALSLGVSLAVVTVMAIVLDGSPLGLTRASWGLALGSVTVLGSGLAYARRPPIETVEAKPTISPAIGWGALAAAIAVLAIVVSVNGVSNAPQTRFTQLWLIPGPTAQTARVGVQNFQTSFEDYRLEVRQGLRMETEWSIGLAPGERWEQLLDISAFDPTEPLVASLYRSSDDSAVFRHVVLQPPLGP